MQAYTRDQFAQFILSLKYPPNAFQLQVLESVAFGTGNIQVSAVAGSGKTTLITMIVALIRHIESIAKLRPSRILPMAFNVTIREELTSRLKQYDVEGENSNRLGNRIISDYLKAKGEKYQKIDDKKYADLAGTVLERKLGKLYETTEQTSDGKPVFKSVWALKHQVAGLVEKCLLSFVSPDNADGIYWMSEHHNTDFKRAIGEVIDTILEEVVPTILREGYQLWQKHRIISLNEQLNLPVVENMDFPTYDWILVDEGQDLNLAQQVMVKRMAKEGTRIIVVGDANQSIMGFAGADDAAWWRMGLAFNTTLYELNISYRCPTNVLDYARAIVPQIQARPDAPEGLVKQDIKQDELYPLLKPDTLILARNNKPIAEMFFELVKQKAQKQDSLTIQVIGRDITESLIRVTSRIKEMGGFNWDMVGIFIGKYQAEELDRISRMRSATRREEAEEELSDILATLDACLENLPSNSMDEFEGKLKETFGASQADEKARIALRQQSASLCTAHKSKGLEAKRVVILEPDKLGSERSGQRAWQYQQELNLMYVAITRAMEDLYVIKGSPDQEGNVVGKLSVSPTAYDEAKAIEAQATSKARALAALSNDLIPGVNVDALLGITPAPVVEPSPVVAQVIEEAPIIEAVAEPVAQPAPTPAPSNSVSEYILLHNDYPVDSGAFHRAIGLARDLKSAGIWDGASPIRFIDAYGIHTATNSIRRLPLTDLVITPERDPAGKMGISVSLPVDSPAGETILEKQPEAQSVQLEQKAEPMTEQAIPTEPVAWAKWLFEHAEDVVILDTETTDKLDYKNPKFMVEAVQISIINLAGDVLFSEYIKPGKAKIAEGASAIHGITDAVLLEKKASSIPFHYAKLQEILKGKHIVAYNSQFDETVLKHSFAAFNRSEIPATWHCAMLKYVAKNPNKISQWGKSGAWWKLTEALEQEGITPSVDAHDALADVRMTRQLLLSMAGLPQDEPAPIVVTDAYPIVTQSMTEVVETPVIELPIVEAPIKVEALTPLPKPEPAIGTSSASTLVIKPVPNMPKVIERGDNPYERIAEIFRRLTLDEAKELRTLLDGVIADKQADPV